MRVIDTHAEYIKKHVRYDPVTGELFWKIPARGRRVGKPMGCIDSKGYVKIQINNVADYAHRVAWLLHYGHWPKDMLDHKNRRPSDNRIDNLRESDNAQNQLNRGLPVNNTTGVKGVSITLSGKYKVTKCGKHLGTFDTKENARQAYENH